MIRIRRWKPCTAVIGCTIGFITALANCLAHPREDEAIVTTTGCDPGFQPSRSIWHTMSESSAWLISNLPERLAR
jgi:hypothetical protein